MYKVTLFIRGEKDHTFLASDENWEENYQDTLIAECDKINIDHTKIVGMNTEYEEDEPVYPNNRPSFMPDDTADWLESIRDNNGIPLPTIDSIIRRAEDECEGCSEEEREQARYDYMRFAGVSEEYADQHRHGIE